MSRALYRLSARFTVTVTKPGRYADGGGLYLLVRQRGEVVERLWVFRHERDARERLVSLGPARDVSLSLARERAERCRLALQLGKDVKAAVRASMVPTFGEVADDYVAAMTPSFRNSKHRAQWHMTLGDAYCAGLRSKPVDEITTDDIVAILRPIWRIKAETAQRLRGRIEKVLAAAKVRGLRSGDNPAAWSNHLELILPPGQKLTRGHHAALPFAELPAVMQRLKRSQSISALALEWTILTAARTGETVHARAQEIRANERVWVVPSERMKSGREHRVPLCDRAFQIFEHVSKSGAPYLFPGQDLREPLSTGAMAQFLKSLQPDITVHGFRSTFRDWVGDATAFDERLAEAALAHVAGDRTERAYRRGDALEKRRVMMDSWANFALTPPARPPLRLVDAA